MSNSRAREGDSSIDKSDYSLMVPVGALLLDPLDISRALVGFGPLLKQIGCQRLFLAGQHTLQHHIWEGRTLVAENLSPLSKTTNSDKSSLTTPGAFGTMSSHFWAGKLLKHILPKSEKFDASCSVRQSKYTLFKGDGGTHRPGFQRGSSKFPKNGPYKL